MKQRIIDIFNNNIQVEEERGRTFIHMPIHQFKDYSPKFVFEIIKDDNGFILSDMSNTIRNIQDEDLFSPRIYDTMVELAPEYRLEIGEFGNIVAKFEQIEHVKYFASYMIQFISVIQYLAKQD